MMYRQNKQTKKNLVPLKRFQKKYYVAGLTATKIATYVWNII